MVELQPFSFALSRESDHLKLTLHNRPSYGEAWVTRILGEACVDAQIKPSNDSRWNSYLIIFPGITAPELRNQEALMREALTRWREQDQVPPFESPGGWSTVPRDHAHTA